METSTSTAKPAKASNRGRPKLPAKEQPLSTQNLTFRFPVDLTSNVVDKLCQTHHWTRSALISRVFAAGLAAECERLDLPELAERVREQYP